MFHFVNRFSHFEVNAGKMPGIYFVNETILVDESLEINEYIMLLGDLSINDRTNNNNTV